MPKTPKPQPAVREKPSTRHVVESAIDASRLPGTWDRAQAEWHKTYLESSWDFMYPVAAARKGGA